MTYTTDNDANCAAFFKCYTATALWSSFDNDSLDLDLAQETLDAMQADCERFYNEQCGAIHCENAPVARDFDGPIAAREAGMAGHDFWLTRCGHGAGFWGGDWPEPYATQLTDAAHAFGNVDLYIGDDGKIYA